MITIYNKEDAAKLTNSELKTLVEGHLQNAAERRLQNLTCIAVIEEGDDPEKELGFTPLHNPLTDLSYGQEDFEPNWDWLEVHPGWFELIYTVGDSGFAFILFVPLENSLISSLCKQFGEGG